MPSARIWPAQIHEDTIGQLNALKFLAVEAMMPREHFLLQVLDARDVRRPRVPVTCSVYEHAEVDDFHGHFQLPRYCRGKGREVVHPPATNTRSQGLHK